MTISYAIPVCNEWMELESLLNYLFKHKRKQDEIVVQCDKGNTTPSVYQVLQEYSTYHSVGLKIIEFPLNKDFASFKNNAKNYCTKDWVFQIDADETLSETFCTIIHQVLEANDEIDLIAVPRVNIVNGLEQNDVMQWGWQLNNQGWVNWPDPQHRIFRNKPEIKWVNKVHEKIIGWKTYAELPSEDDSYALYHIKDIDRQRAQNEFYSTI